MTQYWRALKSVTHQIGAKHVQTGFDGQCHPRAGRRLSTLFPQTHGAQCRRTIGIEPCDHINPNTVEDFSYSYQMYLYLYMGFDCGFLLTILLKWK